MLESVRSNTNFSLQINCFRYNQTKTLICVSTNQGYRIYDSKEFKLLSSGKESLGDINQCITLYSSKIVIFKGNRTNSTYTYNQLVFWNDYLNKIIGSITFNQSIEDYYITKSIIIVKCRKGLMLFDISTLKFITIIEPNEPSIIFSSIDHNDNDLFSMIAYTIKDFDTFIIKRIQHKYIDDITQSPSLLPSIHIQTKRIKTIFSDIKIIEFIQSYLLVSNHYGNKIHLYSNDDMTLKYCFFLGYYPYVLGNFSIDKKKKYFMLSTNNKYIKMFKLKDSVDTTCQCSRYSDEEIDLDRSGKLFFYWNKVFGSISEMYCKFRYNSQVRTLAWFDQLKKNEINLIESNGKMMKIVFNRKICSDINTDKICYW